MCSHKTKTRKRQIELIGSLASLLLLSIPVLLHKAMDQELGVLGEKKEIASFGTHLMEKPEMTNSLYVPSITLVKSAPVLNGSDCGGIPFTFTITNESTNAENLINIVLTDPDLGGVLAGPNPGDFSGDTGGVGGDGILSQGETWTFNFNYPITQNDLENGFFGTQAATVTADVQGQGISVNDISHPSDSSADGPTIVDLSNCQNASIGLVKGWSYVDLDGSNPPCVENFLYTFTVRNIGNLDLHNIVLEDNLLGGTVPGPAPNSDVGDDGILNPGEEWQYQALYSADLNQSGTIINQATIFAETVGQGIQISDLSDDDGQDSAGLGAYGTGPTLDDPTSSPYDEVCTGAFARMGLIKTGSPLDLNGDGCPETIQYTFTLQNVGQADIEEIGLTDDLLGGVAPTLVNNGNGNAVLEAGEVWIYEAQYAITLADLTNGSITNDALVEGKLVGFDIFLFDHSDDNSFDENDQTVTSMMGFCSPSDIGLIKAPGALVDLDSDGCPETIHYTFTVFNTGGMDLDRVVLNDTKLGGLVTGPVQGSDLNNDGILSVFESWTYEALYPITQQDIDAGQVLNQADVTAFEVGSNTQISDLSDDDSINENEQTVTSVVGACVAQAGIGLIKNGVLVDLDIDGCAEAIRYTFTVANTGSIELDQLVLNDPILGGPIAGPIQGSDLNNDGILSVSESWTYEGIYPMTQQDIDAGQVVNQADITAFEVVTNNQISDLSDDNSFSEDDTTTTSTVGGCLSLGNIGLIKSDSGALLDLNNDGCPETIGYIFTVQNIGSLDLEQIVLNDANLGGQISGPTQGSDVNNDGILSVNETWTYEAQYPIAQPDIDAGQVANQADVVALELGTNNPVSDLSDDDSFVEDQQTITSVVGACVSEANISLIKIASFLDLDGDNCFETIRYDFLVTNTGSLTLDQIVLNDPMLGGDINGPQPNSDDNNDGLLSPLESWSFIAIYPIDQNDIDLGSITNQAQVVAFEQGTNNQVSDMVEITTPLGANNTCVAQAGIGLIKTGSLLDLDGDGCPETIQYVFTVSNIGASDLNQVVLSDANLGGQIAGPSQGSDVNNDGILSLNETWTYEVLYPISQPDLDAGQVANQATVTASETGTNNPVSDLSDDDSFAEDQQTITSVAGTCVAQASIGLIKTAGGALLDLDGDACPETIQYTFTVANTGSIDLQQVVLTDVLLQSTISGPLLGNDINNDGILSVNETWTFQAQYPIRQNDIDTGQVINQAQVSAMEVLTSSQVSDLSDDNSFSEDDSTITSVAGACAAISCIDLIKAATLLDLDGDECAETIQYTFTVENTGTISLYQISIVDPLLQNGITGPLTGNDINNDGVLSFNEIWTYEAQYTITQADIDAGVVTNQAQVSALEEVTNNPITDDSDEVLTPVSDGCIDPTNPVDPNFKIFNGITPNGDNVNDFFEIRGIENYPDNSLKIFNRWGVLVFEAEGYGLSNRFFNGQSEGRTTVAQERALPTGTYFYVLTFVGSNPGEESYSGYLYISRD
ncbi:gliding motility-associated C-terminal domain-containing protein [Flagellimonas meishanensis]|uniref:gliding motility-associated C-terminal domain-containing protein n=1 Tax=Flagellimonas meishanensis TaxID=2873264 RepID=UPI001CA6F92B|nr:gliding motility-associated C-terminal domain-containing protein [[Muricauda] meishanensis]